MAVPWLAVGKLVLTNLDTVINVVKPVFTRKKVDVMANQADLLNQQIAELQAASSSNAEQIKELAAQMKQMVTAVDQAALNVVAESKKAWSLMLVAVSISVVSLIAVVLSILAR